jgi:YbbR domain-containing protein
MGDYHRKKREKRKMDYRKLFLKIAENWPAKVISIMLAILLFVFHKADSLEKRVFSAPMHIEMDGNYTLASPADQSARITLRGEANSMYSVLENDIEAFVNLKGKGKGTYRAPVQIRRKGSALTADSFEISVYPIEISLTIDYKASKYVRVSPKTRGSPKDGYWLVSSSLTPENSVIEGPADALAAITELFTEDIDLEGRDSDFSVMVDIVNYEPLAVIRGNPTTEFKGVIRREIAAPDSF